MNFQSQIACDGEELEEDLGVPRFIVRLIVLLLAFAVGVVATDVRNRFCPRFENTALGAIRTNTDGIGGFRSYKTADGNNLIFEHLDFPTAGAAEEEFQKEVNQAERVLQREPAYDRHRKVVVGEIVVAAFRAKNAAGTEFFAIMCRDDKTLYSVTSTSLRLVLAFDRTYRRY